MKIAFVLCFLCMVLPFPAWSAQKDCEAGATTMGEVRYCEEQQERAAVQRAYDHLLAHLKRVNPAASKLLIQAQKDWLTFATSTCEYYTRVRTEGQMANDFRAQCWADFNSARIRWLQASEQDLGKRF
jgi:uncharacterized protein YecT (DUF1311 family)